MLMNGLKLLVVSFTPFATALLADKIGTESQQIAVSVYTGTFFLMGLSMIGIWCYAQYRGFTHAASPQRPRRRYPLLHLRAGARGRHLPHVVRVGVGELGACSS